MTLFQDLDHYTPALDHAEAAAAYQRLEHNPAAAGISYSVFGDHVMRQWDWIAQRVSVEFFSGAPRYASSAEMLADLDRGHLYTFVTDPIDSGMPSDHPMLATVGLERSEYIQSPGSSRPRVLNDIFRAVHDVMGHGTSRGSFGVNGEMNAWLAHRAMFPIAAHSALWCETRGQSAWTNAWDDHASRPLVERPFAAQKAGMPEIAFI